jgi:hypothetical protein
VTLYLAEKGGSRTLREPYGPQTGFEDQRHHRAPSFSSNKINYLRRGVLFCLSIRLSKTNPVPNALATSVAWRSTYLLCIWTELCPDAFIAMSTAMPMRAHCVRAVFLRL